MCTTSPGILTYSELRAAGASRRLIAARVAAGVWVPLRRGVYAHARACDAARQAAAHGGALACVTAARHLGLWVLDAETAVHVWLDHGHRYRHAPCHCVEHWDEGDRQTFAMPSVPRILRQILHCRGVEDFFVALESARRQGRVTPDGMAWLRTHTGPAGRDAIGFSRADADSGIESLLRWRLRTHGLSIRCQVDIVSVGRVDFLIGDRLIIEVDGRENHDGESKRHKDLVRDANAAAWGYTTLRFDYAMVVHDWESVELAILTHVDRGTHLARDRAHNGGRFD